MVDQQIILLEIVCMTYPRAFVKFYAASFVRRSSKSHVGGVEFTV